MKQSMQEKETVADTRNVVNALPFHCHNNKIIFPLSREWDTHRGVVLTEAVAENPLYIDIIIRFKMYPTFCYCFCT